MDNYIDIPAVAELLYDEKVLVLNVYDDKTTADGRIMLNNVNKACGLDTEIQTSQLPVSDQVSLGSVVKNHTFLAVVIYGLSPKQVGLQIECPRYQWVTFQNTKWCFAERLDEINADMNKKKQLWSCLKDLKVLSTAS